MLRKRIFVRRKRLLKSIEHTPEKDELNLHEYDNLFPLEKDIDGKSKREKALEKAWEIRNFEINLYWQRATYFWAFIASSFVAYFAAISSEIIQRDFKPLEYIVICIGFIFSLAWTFVNIGSKNWQKNWEGHIDRLEEEFTGPLYRTVRKSIYSFSVSRINIIVSSFITLIWLLLGYSFYQRNHFKFTTSFQDIDPVITITNYITLIISLLMIIFGKTGFKFYWWKNPYKIRKINE